MMRNIIFKKRNGKETLTWVTDDGIKQTVKNGDRVNVIFRNPIFNIYNGYIVDIFSDGSFAVNNGKGFIQICFYGSRFRDVVDIICA